MHQIVTPLPAGRGAFDKLRDLRACLTTGIVLAILGLPSVGQATPNKHPAKSAAKSAPALVLAATGIGGLTTDFSGGRRAIRVPNPYHVERMSAAGNRPRWGLRGGVRQF